MTKVLRSFWLWSAAFAVVATLSFTLSSGGSIAAHRIAHLESLVRCPACEDISVAQSPAPSAIAVRHEIERRVHAGASDTEILTSLEARYGTGILLSPRGSGLDALLWIVPLVVFVSGALFFVRAGRRR